MKKQIWIASAVGICCLVAAFVAFSFQDDANVEAAKPATPELEIVKEDPQAGNFSVLGDVSSDLLDSKSAGFVSSLIGWSQTFRTSGESGIAPISRAGEVSLDDGSLASLVAIEDNICVYIDGGIDDGRGGCSPMASVLKEGSFGVAPDTDGGDSRILGVVSDQVETIVVPGKPETEAKVQGNVVRLSLPPRDTTIVGVDASGKRVFSRELPLELYDSVNDSPADAK